MDFGRFVSASGEKLYEAIIGRCADYEQQQKQQTMRANNNNNHRNDNITSLDGWANQNQHFIAIPPYKIEIPTGLRSAPPGFGQIIYRFGVGALFMPINRNQNASLRAQSPDSQRRQQTQEVSL